MRTLKTLGIAAIAIAFLYACEDDETNPSSGTTASGNNGGNGGGGNNPTGYYLQAELDGQATSFTVFPGSIDQNSIILGGIGPNNGFPQFILTIPKDADPQTYNYPVNLLDTTIKSVGISYSLNDSTFYLANRGSFVLSKHDKPQKLIEGNFNVTLYKFSLTDPDSIVVTNGQLRQTYN